MKRQDSAASRSAEKQLRVKSLSRGIARSASPVALSLKLSATILLALSAFFLLLMPRAVLPAGDSFYHIREINPHVFVWIADDVLDQEGDPKFNRAGNAGFIITQDGVVVVNTTNSPFNARALLYEIRQHTDLPVRYVINTGATPDVMLGNESFTDFKPDILATPEATSAMMHYRDEFPARLEDDWRFEVSMRGVHPTPPNHTFINQTTVPLSGQPIKVINLGDNTAPGDAAVYLPQSKVLFLGNVFENEYIPRIGSANIDNWIKTLHKVESWDVDIYVPGHGQPAGKAQVLEFRHFLEWLSGQVRSGLQKGKTLEQLQNDLVPFPNIHWHAPELESEAVAAVYRSLTRHNNEASSSPKSANQ